MQKKILSVNDRGFIPVEHTADIGLKLWGQVPEDLFYSGLMGLRYLADRSLCNNAVLEARAIEIDSPDMESLLVDFLNELLYMINSENWIPAEIDDICITGSRLICSIMGSRSDSGPGTGREIKAATYHNLEIRKNDDSMSTVVYFDI
ncbi:MAG: archease [Elusimicrobiota bacterium]